MARRVLPGAARSTIENALLASHEIVSTESGLYRGDGFTLGGIRLADFDDVANISEADKVLMADGGNVQDAIMAAADAIALVATTKAFPVGSALRTVDGSIYKVALNNATDHDLTTAAGIKLYVQPNGMGEVSAKAFGVTPDGTTNWETDFASRMVALYRASTRYCVVFPKGNYATGMNLDATFNGSRMRFDGAVFYGILHLIEGIQNVHWSGDVASYDRLGVQAGVNIRLPEIVRMLHDPAKNTAYKGVGNRGVHLLGCSNVSWGQMIIDDTSPMQAALPGDQSIWSAFTIQSQGLSGFKGSVWIKNASGHGSYINALDIDIDIRVDGYGKLPIQFAPGGALEGTDGQTQSQQGCGVWLNRCTGRVAIEVAQVNVLPEADTYAVLIDETGVSSVPSSRDKPLVVSRLMATVGNGNRGVCIGDSLSPSVTCNVNLLNGALIAARAAGTLAAGFAAINVVAPSTAASASRRFKSVLPIETVGFTTQTQFKVTGATGTNVFTEVDIDGVYTGSMGAGRFVHIDGTGGLVRGRIGRIQATYEAGSSAVPAVDLDGAVNFNIEGGLLRATSPNNTRAVRFANCVDSSITIPTIFNFGRTAPEGGFSMSDLTRCRVRDTRIDRANVEGVGFLFAGTLEDCTFEGLRVKNTDTGFGRDGVPVFTRSAAITCTATDNAAQTNLTVAMFPAENQVVCTNFTVVP